MNRSIGSCRPGVGRHVGRRTDPWLRQVAAWQLALQHPALYRATAPARPGASDPVPSIGGTPLKRPLTAARVATAVAAFICPTCRQAVPYPYPQWFVYNLHNTPPAVGHTDYAGCVGDTDEAATSGPLTFGPDTGRRGPLPNDFHNASQTGGDDMPSNVQWLAVRLGYYCADGGYSTAGLITTGVFAVHTPKTMASISDGASNTYLVGEKCCDPDHYVDGGDNGDNKGWDFGFIFGNVRGPARSPGGTLSPASRSSLLAAPGHGGHPGIGNSEHAQCPLLLLLRQRPCLQLQHGLLRRLGPLDQLFDRPGNPPPSGQHCRWPEDRRQGVLKEENGTGPMK